MTNNNNGDTDYHAYHEDMTYDTEEEKRQRHSLYFSFFSISLAFVLLLSSKLHVYPKINAFISEAALILIFGIAVGGAVRLVIYATGNNDLYIQDEDENPGLANSLLSFSSEVFFMALIPPILFYSGYQLRRELFYRHIKPIIMFAAIGTTVSALVTGISLFVIEKLRLIGGDFHPTLMELLTFGTLIAATDTVSLIAVLRAKRVDPHLFYLVFGESALNDAVALVLFGTCADFLREEVLTPATVYDRLVKFFCHFGISAFCSPAVGILYGFIVALIFKHNDLREQPMLELSFYLLCFYLPYAVAESFQLSGIVAIFFSGISARRYITPNLSPETVKNGEALFKVAAYLAEVCIFLELGLSVFGLSADFSWSFVVWSLLACLVGRAASIYPLAFLYNWNLKQIKRPPTPQDETTTTEVVPEIEDKKVNPKKLLRMTTESFMEKYEKYRTPERKKDKQISLEKTHILWFAGLRGAVAYACAREFPDVYGNSHQFVTATVVIVLFTIILMGGATEYLLQVLNIETGVDEDEYMDDWHKKRKLKGIFHDFESEYMYAFAVRRRGSGSTSDSSSNAQSDEPSADFFAYDDYQAETSSQTNKDDMGLAPIGSVSVINKDDMGLAPIGSVSVASV